MVLKKMCNRVKGMSGAEEEERAGAWPGIGKSRWLGFAVRVNAEAVHRTCSIAAGHVVSYLV